MLHLTPFPHGTSDCPAGLTQPLRFAASFPWSPRQSRLRVSPSAIIKNNRENKFLSKLKLFSLLFFAPLVLLAVCSALVIPAGFEPTTHSLEGCCSIQLSYGTIRIALFCKCSAKVIYFFQLRYILSTIFRIKSNNRREGR